MLCQLSQLHFGRVTFEDGSDKRLIGERRSVVGDHPSVSYTHLDVYKRQSVLSSPRAVEMSIFVVRAFLRLRETLATHKALAAKLAELEQRLETTDHKIVEIVKAIHLLAMPPEKPVRRIGFRPDAVSKPKILEAGKGANDISRPTPR